MTRPKILILDESTNGMSGAVERQTHEMMLANVDMDEQTDDEYQESGYEGRYLELGSAASGQGQVTRLKDHHLHR